MKSDLLVQRPAAVTRLVLLHGVGTSAEDLLPHGLALATRQPQAWVVNVRSPDPLRSWPGLAVVLGAGRDRSRTP